MIYVHNDMAREYKLRGNFHMPSIRLAYRDFDKIVPIREGLDAVTLRSFPGVQPEKIHIAHNVNDIEGIREKSGAPARVRRRHLLQHGAGAGRGDSRESGQPDLHEHRPVLCGEGP